MKTLKTMQPGDLALVVAVDGGCRVRSRLESLGILPGTQVEVLNNGNGPMIVSLGEGSLMIERGVAEKILVV
ncbi:ferrous iron transport protein A [Paucidesulfovibrio gracilis DSM 16080]|uniref:Ferrous iron transport protein A n=1 Tax=Paucidesulfovibrio gracilis DSM 16080 TaxID=1121449 RepID=A0A1T4WYR4_9BACT|nr:FeoA family protein [Paucidesulfovibrio gracilis]SKA82466.1 ferrous iron transport protein A [Paucidesulfovibrio gracilis DSM 16080]